MLCQKTTQSARIMKFPILIQPAVEVCLRASELAINDLCPGTHVQRLSGNRLNVKMLCPDDKLILVTFSGCSISQMLMFEVVDN